MTKVNILQKTSYICIQIRKRVFRVFDIMAFYFALTEGVWKTLFGIVRFKKQGKTENRLFLCLRVSWCARLSGVGQQESASQRGGNVSGQSVKCVNESGCVPFCLHGFNNTQVIKKT